MTTPLEPVPDPVTLTGQQGAPYLAVDVQPDNVTGVFTLDDSELEGPDLLAWSDSDPGLWVNIVCDVTRVAYRRGAARTDGRLTQTEAGTVTVELDDTGHAFDPMTNADAIRKGTPLRVRAWGTDAAGERWDAVLITAEVDQLMVAYRHDDAPAVTITAWDVIGPLAAWRAEGRPEPGVGAADTLRQRVSRCLTEIGRGVISPDSDLVYAAGLAPTTLANPWQTIVDATEAELGRLWVDKSNRLVVRARGSELTGPVRGTLSDVHGEAPAGVHCCVADAAVVYGAETMANRALAGRRHPGGDESPTVVVRRDDEDSQVRYGVATVERQSLELDTDAQLAPWAQAVIVGHTLPELRVESVTPAPSEDDLDSALAAWPAVLATDVGDRWRFLYHPQVGPVVDRTLGVLGIDVEATPDAWRVTWTTAPAPAQDGGTSSGWFVLDVSPIGGGALLSPFAVPA